MLYLSNTRDLLLQAWSIPCLGPQLLPPTTSLTSMYIHQLNFAAITSLLTATALWAGNMQLRVASWWGASPQLL